jgi:hypothetical protein
MAGEGIDDHVDVPQAFGLGKRALVSDLSKVLIDRADFVN